MGKTRTQMFIVAITVFVLFGLPVFGLPEEQTVNMVITEVTELLQVTKPDGTTMKVVPEDVPVQIPLGSTVETISGTARIDVCRLIGGLEGCSSIAVISPESSAQISFDKASGRVTVHVLKGIVNVYLRAMVAKVEAGEKLTIRKDRKTGQCVMVATEGDINVVLGDGTETILEEGEEEEQEPEEIIEEPIKPEPIEPEPIEGSPYLPD